MCVKISIQSAAVSIQAYCKTSLGKDCDFFVFIGLNKIPKNQIYIHLVNSKMHVGQA